MIWSGRQHLAITNRSDLSECIPVRICAGALADGIPARDLRVSPRHAIFWSGGLFEAISLVNGITIFQEQSTRSVTHHHLETDQHDLILAEGCETETFLDHGHRHLFDDNIVPLTPLPAYPKDAKLCAPLFLEGTELDALRYHLVGRADRLALHGVA